MTASRFEGPTLTVRVGEVEHLGPEEALVLAVLRDLVKEFGQFGQTFQISARAVGMKAGLGTNRVEVAARDLTTLAGFRSRHEFVINARPAVNGVMLVVGQR